jgi:hypothetical protein
VIGQEGAATRRRDMAQAIRDQWLIAVAVVVVIGLAVWLWTTRAKR